MSMVRGDAAAIPLRDESVDLVVTSPPYFNLRSYTDGGEHYSGQIGSEETPDAFLEALWAVTAECADCEVDLVDAKTEVEESGRGS